MGVPTDLGKYETRGQRLRNFCDLVIDKNTIKRTTGIPDNRINEFESQNIGRH